LTVELKLASTNYMLLEMWEVVLRSHGEAWYFALRGPQCPFSSASKCYLQINRSHKCYIYVPHNATTEEKAHESTLFFLHHGPSWFSSLCCEHSGKFRCLRIVVFKNIFNLKIYQNNIFLKIIFNINI
jgi:hypothetical protein